VKWVLSGGGCRDFVARIFISEAAASSGAFVRTVNARGALPVFAQKYYLCTLNLFREDSYGSR
jgi:hypothetical protein